MKEERYGITVRDAGRIDRITVPIELRRGGNPGKAPRYRINRFDLEEGVPDVHSATSRTPAAIALEEISTKPLKLWTKLWTYEGPYPPATRRRIL